MLSLIDMDLVVFRCAASAENEEFDIAVARTNELLDQLLLKTEATSYRAFLTGKDSFRKKLYPEYKANRTTPKPKHLEELRSYACSNLNAEVTEDGLEADDYLGIFQTNYTTIVSLDKDLLQIPGKHYRWAIGTAKWTKDEEYITQTELEGSRLFYEQCLKGDVSDNVKGVKGIGEKGAKKLLADCETEKEMIQVCLEQYASEEEFLMNAQCLYILRSFDDSYIGRYDGIRLK